MTPWRLGEAEIEALLAKGHLQRVSGGGADGAPFMERARRSLGSARMLAPDDPENAFSLAYAAVRIACTGVLAQQGLRPTQAGGHVVVEDAMRAQFGDNFQAYTWLRRRRNDVDYARRPDDLPDADEVAEAMETAASLLDAASALLPRLGLF